jgi:inosine-uridine nucleoside N-ribohydrolase
MGINRRHVLSGGAIATGISALGSLPVFAKAISGTPDHKPFAPVGGPRKRVLLVNDLSGDIDGLYAAVHAILSPSIDLRGIVGTAARSKDETTQGAVALANEMLSLMRMTDRVKVFEGAPEKMSAAIPVRSPGSQAIIDEAMRTDAALPLVVAVGGGLTEVASALLIEPGIADRMTIIWIGGNPYPNGGPHEYNFSIDPLAAQHVFNATNLRIWQVPSDVYATCLVSDTELQAFVAPCGQIGAWLYRKVFENAAKIGKFGVNLGETYTLGDSPLVALTALTDWLPTTFTKPFEYERTSTSKFDDIPAPMLNPDGSYSLNPSGRKIRVYRSIDTRLMFSDFFAKMKVNFE